MLLNIDEEALAKKIQDLIFNEIAGCLPKRAEIRLNLQPVIAEAVISSREYFHDITKEAIQEALQDEQFIITYKAAIKEVLQGKFVGELARTMISASMREAGKTIGSDKEFTQSILEGGGYEKPATNSRWTKEG